MAIYKAYKNPYYVTLGDSINDNIDRIRNDAYGMIIDRYHGRQLNFDDSDNQLLADIDAATVKIIQAVKRWEEKNCCCCDVSPAVDEKFNAEISKTKTYPPYLDHEK